MFRKLFCFGLISLLVGPMCALALEIGEIQVNSALNQLFDAKIPLPNLTPEELSKVSVKLGSSSMFKEFSLDRTPILAKLVFSIEYNPEGEVYVKVVSTEPIREPSLGLLLEFGWPRGKTFREFTVFLDPVERLAKRRIDRTKTVLEPSPTDPSRPTVASASQPSVAPPAPEPATAATVTSEPATIPEPTSTVAAVPTEPAATASQALPPSVAPVADGGAETAHAPAVPSSSPVEIPPPRTYKGGDSYGPVAAGENLWKIALTVRPDPDITPDQMMQTLFKANPHAFAKSGIDGLKVGATLRVPTLREIANLTDSTTARRLAEAEEAAASVLGSSAQPAAAEPLAGPSSIMEAQAGADSPKVFALALPESIEPTTIEMAPPLAAVLKGETFRIAAQIRPPRSMSAPRPAIVAGTVAPPILEPVSVTPLLYLAVSETMKAIFKIPAFAIPAQIVPGAIIADVPASPPTQKIFNINMALPVVTSKHETLIRKVSKMDTTVPVVTAEPVAESPKANDQITAPDLTLGIATDLLAMLDERIQSAAFDLTPFVLEAKPFIASPTMVESTSMVPPETPPLPLPANVEKPEQLTAEAVAAPPPVVETPPAVEVAAPPPVVETPPAEVAAPPAVLPKLEGNYSTPSPAASVEPEQLTAEAVAPPPVVETPPAEATAPPAVEVTAPPPVSPTIESAKPATEATYKGGEQYGPVVPNERLWDIAAKVRPDPSIGKDVMMKALFVANPQAFSKSGINQMKLGVLLRVPTLQEIVEYTGSEAAKQLLDLERQQAAITALPKPEGNHSAPGPAASAQSVELPSTESVVPAMERTSPMVESKPN
ncbi:MAG: FimV/HubP family polar landmark protein [Candidatus Competibacter sp.]